MKHSRSRQKPTRGTAGSILFAHHSFLKTDKLIKGLTETDKAEAKAMPTFAHTTLPCISRNYQDPPKAKRCPPSSPALILLELSGTVYLEQAPLPFNISSRKQISLMLLCLDFGKPTNPENSTEAPLTMRLEDHPTLWKT